MKKFIIILLVVELLASYFVAGSGCFYRQDQVRAFAAWRDHPTPETRAELDRQKHITELHSLGFSAIVFCGLAGVTLFIAGIWGRKHVTQIEETTRQ